MLVVVYHYVYHVGFTIVFVFATPLALIIVFNVRSVAICCHYDELLNCRLVRSLRAALQARDNLRHGTDAHKNDHSNAVTCSLVAMVTKFICCQTPDFVSAIWGAVAGIEYNIVAACKILVSSQAAKSTTHFSSSGR